MFLCRYTVVRPTLPKTRRLPVACTDTCCELLSRSRLQNLSPLSSPSNASGKCGRACVCDGRGRDRYPPHDAGGRLTPGKPQRYSAYFIYLFSVLCGLTLFCPLLQLSLTNLFRNTPSVLFCSPLRVRWRPTRPCNTVVPPPRVSQLHSASIIESEEQQSVHLTFVSFRHYVMPATPTNPRLM